jgi:crotonobetainyl-CoA:carnitine CoA-transferase CaiB-like acyl-CoA transferase
MSAAEALARLGSAAALGGIRVLDLSTGVAGQYCGKLLAGYGADCVLAEPPEGTPTRRMGPYLTSGRSSTRSVLFRHLNQGKSSLVHQTGDGRMQAVAALADVVIRDDATPLPFTLPQPWSSASSASSPAAGLTSAGTAARWCTRRWQARCT